MEIELSYKPLTLKDGKISERDYNLYLTQPSCIAILEKMVIDPLEESMKKREKKEFDFVKFKVIRTWQNKKSVSWENVHTNLAKLLEIRADDSRNVKIPCLQKLEGIGYCISIQELLGFIRKQITDNTSTSEYPQLYWPKRKKKEYIREIILPDRNYLIINQENAYLALQAKKFCSSLEKEINESYKLNNQTWFEKETGFSKNNIPKKEESPLERRRKIAEGKYVYIALIRKETPKYEAIINSLLSDLNNIRAGQSLKGYKQKKLKNEYFVNISNILEKTSLDNVLADPNLKKELVKVEGKYVIAP